MTTLYLCGAGNSEGLRLAHNVNRAEHRWDRVVVLDDDALKHGRSLLDVEIAGPFSLLAEADPGASEVVNLVARTTMGRWGARDRIERHGLPFASMISPDVDTYGAELDRDLIVYQHATLGPEASIGEATVVFMGAVVGHECRVGRCCVLAANSVLNARVELGDGVYLGTNATVLPEVRVGAWATIGAGSVVVEDVPEGATVMGVPAEVLTSPSDDDPGHAGDRVAAAPTRVDPEIERTIAAIWEELLHLPGVDVNRNFFDLGGGSLLAVKMRDQVQRATGVHVSLTDMFRFPTIRSLAGHIVGDGPGRPDATRAQVRRQFRRQWRPLTD